VPAAAVIPAPIAYTKVVAVKKLVVDFLVVGPGPRLTACVCWVARSHLRGVFVSGIKLLGAGILVFYCE
jgi:hypothetical protein